MARRGEQGLDHGAPGPKGTALTGGHCTPPLACHLHTLPDLLRAHSVYLTLAACERIRVHPDTPGLLPMSVSAAPHIPLTLTWHPNSHPLCFPPHPNSLLPHNCRAESSRGKRGWCRAPLEPHAWWSQWSQEQAAAAPADSTRGQGSWQQEGVLSFLGTASQWW